MAIAITQFCFLICSKTSLNSASFIWGLAFGSGWSSDIKFDGIRQDRKKKNLILDKFAIIKHNFTSRWLYAHNIFVKLPK